MLAAENHKKAPSAIDKEADKSSIAENNNSLETPQALKSEPSTKKPQPTPSDDSEDDSMYTKDRFFDPEILSYKPIRYPNINMIEGYNTQIQNQPLTQQ